MPAVGDVAPDFTLKDQNGNDVTLTELRGNPVVIVFYPFTFTGVCQGELQGRPSHGRVRVRDEGLPPAQRLKQRARRELARASHPTPPAKSAATRPRRDPRREVGRRVFI